MVLIIVLVVVGVLILASGAFLGISAMRRPGGRLDGSKPLIEERPPPGPVPTTTPSAEPGPDLVLESPPAEEEAEPEDAPGAVVEAERIVQEATTEKATTQEAITQEAITQEAETVGLEAPAPEELVAERPRLVDRLGKARSFLAGKVGAVLSRSAIEAETWDELEEALIGADVGVATTGALLEELRAKVKAGEVRGPQALVEALKGELAERLAAGDRSLSFEPGCPNVWLFVGVNGVGKTTTIGKVGLRESQSGRSVVMAAGDTFRAAAAEQLELWSKRVGADLVRGAEGGDPGSVVFDAVQRASARKADLVLADTAGRLHTKANLMEELKKVRRIAERPPAKLSEVLLVIDATTGQNGLIQARQFTEAAGVTGVVLTKLDGTAKGGIVVAIQADLGIPVKLVGVGEAPSDLIELDPEEFVEALFT